MRCVCWDVDKVARVGDALLATDFNEAGPAKNKVVLGGAVVGVSNRGAPITAAALGVNTGRQDTDFGVVRVGLNYKFSTW